MNYRYYAGPALTIALAVMICISPLSQRACADGANGDLASLSMEDLANIQITSFSKRSASLSGTPAAVYVITGEDIRRSGLSNIAELLRLVPGMQVARSSAHSWVISSRGLADDFSSKLLVMIDGRSVYSPFHAGVMWNIQDLVLEDIDRVEVIRGSGGVMWGANAVNGVVNIITKDAQETKGTMASTDTGAILNSYAPRYGAKIGERGALRVFAKEVHVPDFPYTDPTDPSGDGYSQSRAGFRYDMDISEVDKLSVQGDAYTGDGNNNPWTDEVSTHVSGGDMMLSYYNHISPTDDSVLQMYYDQSDHNDSVLHYRTGTVDLDYTRRQAIRANREVTWGLGYRSIRDRILPTINVQPEEGSKTYSTLSAFLQEDRTVSKSGLRIIAGTKIERNTFSGFEIQPSLRALQPLGDDSSVWAAVSRSVRTPSRMETGVILQFDPKHLPDGTPVVRRVYPNSDLLSEDMLSYEIGYRLRKSYKWSLDVAAYYNNYQHLRTVEQATPFPEPMPDPSYYVVPLHMANNMSGRVCGVELTSDWTITPTWRMIGSFTLQDGNFKLAPTSTDPYSLELFRDNIPRVQSQLQSRWTISDRMDLDVLYFHVGKLIDKNIPGYDRVDLHLGWQAQHGLQVVLGVQNLFNQEHSEWNPDILIPRTVYAKAVWGL